MIDGLRTERKRTPFVKYGVLVLILLLAIIILFFLRKTYRRRYHHVEVCTSFDCQFTASRILQNMDPEYCPCDNFYQFACGNFLKSTSVPIDKQKITVGAEIEDSISMKLKELFENFISSQEEKPSPYRSVLQLYSLCMDLNSLNRTGVDEARKVLKKAGKWPLLNESSDSSSWGFFDTEITFKSLGLNGNTLLRVHLDVNTSDIQLVVQKPELVLHLAGTTPTSRAPLLEAYNRYLVDLATVFGVERTLATEAARDVVEFEISLSFLMDSIEENKFTSNSYNLEQLSNLGSLNWIPWKSLYQFYNLTDNQTAIIENPEYIFKLNDFLKARSATVIANFMLWRAMGELAPLASDSLRILQDRFLGRQTQPRWRHCVQDVSRKLGIAVSSLYVKHLLHPKTKVQAQTLLENIRQEMIKNKQQSPIVDENTSEIAVNEIKSVTTNVAYPAELLELEKLAAYYENLKMSQTSFLEASLDISKWRLGLGGGHNLKSPDWSRFAEIIDPTAHFSTEEKYISVNAGLLQAPVFSTSLPQYVNYGALGYLLAHHMFHTPSKSQLDSKKIPSKGGIVYKGALRMAYQAYRKHVTQLATPEADLPDLSRFSHQQLFMLSMANMLCTKYSNDTTNSPIEVRVNAVVKSSPEFKDIFKC